MTDLEEAVARQLQRAGCGFEFEPGTIGYVQPERQAEYLPDFKLGNGIFIEVKNRFDTDDRRKHLLLKRQRPELDVRFVFSDASRPLTKGSRRTYADWCKENGFKFAEMTVPKEWLEKEQQ